MNDPTMPPQVYVVLFEDKLRPGQLRASVTVLETSEAAAAKAFDITNMQKVKAWVMGCPDPRQIANG
jgi:hypothetical protein